MITLTATLYTYIEIHCSDSFFSTSSCRCFAYRLIEVRRLRVVQAGQWHRREFCVD
jgi:hypothetical protein